MANIASEGIAPLWHWLGHQLAHPEGGGGVLVGRAMSLANREPYRLAIEALRPAQQDRVLEIGFGPGAGIAALAACVPGGHVAGIEGSPAMLRLAASRNRGAVAGGQVELREGDFRALPWAGASFDGVLAVNVAYFFDAGGAAAFEIRRVLKPGGRAVLYVTDRSTMARWPFAGADTHRTYDAAELRRLLVQGGFRDADIRVVAHRLPFGVEGLIAVARAA
ncbi:class I SAM-dependent methyltransferase [Xanthobacter sp. 126]|uniref:class I SAM-dependent methyltransferase n=1 Tax=Xanthobacter sp. 126 TaxID=1131814 RepID=UPI00045EC322|nr:class I SAM-dependent methyltransferase [Xanthobacter sp. 126]